MPRNLYHPLGLVFGQQIVETSLANWDVPIPISFLRGGPLPVDKINGVIVGL